MSEENDKKIIDDFNNKEYEAGFVSNIDTEFAPKRLK